MSFDWKPESTTRMGGLVRWTKLVLYFLYIFLLTFWAVLALYFDFNMRSLRVVAAITYVFVVTALLVFCKRPLQRFLASTLCFALVLLWWLSLAPSDNGHWQSDVSRTAYAEIDGSRITFYNVRSCNYRTELDYTCQWLTRRVDLDRVRGVDLFMNYWGSPLIAHTILSFDLEAGPSRPDGKSAQHLAFSIEARKQIGQQYSSIRGFFRQYTLISVVSDERDVVRLRTNYRRGEDLYLYHTRATPAFARSLLLDYAAFTNQLHSHPQWYNAVTRNCTTEIFTLDVLRGYPKDWRILFNGKADAMLYDQNELAAEVPGQSPDASRLPFAELKRRAYINPAAQTADSDPNFSERIRENHPGFENAELK